MNELIGLLVVIISVCIVGALIYFGPTIYKFIKDTIEWNIQRLKWKYWDKD